MSDSLQPHGRHHARLPCPSPTTVPCSNSCPSSQWCHPTILPSVIYFSSCLQPFQASGSFPVNQFFTSGGQSIGVSASASVLPRNIQDWFPLGLTGWISLQSKGSSRIFSNTTRLKLQCTLAFWMLVSCLKWTWNIHVSQGRPWNFPVQWWRLCSQFRGSGFDPSSGK